ncbi:unnamed protein product, partial [Polarella glacialis]
RHLPRLRTAISEAVSLNLLSQANLALLNPYLPNLSLQWTMYRSIAQPPPSEPEFVNRMMGGILSAAARCGEDGLRKEGSDDANSARCLQLVGSSPYTGFVALS